MSVFSILGPPQGQMRGRLIFALDVATTKEAIDLVDLLKDEVGLFKVGKLPIQPPGQWAEPEDRAVQGRKSMGNENPPSYM